MDARQPAASTTRDEADDAVDSPAITDPRDVPHRRFAQSGYGSAQVWATGSVAEHWLNRP